MSDFAVIIPTYNRSGVICDALASVFAQTVLPDEVVVIDDGSTDNTLQVLDAWQHSLPDDVLPQVQKRLRIVSQDNAWVSVARNHGACLTFSELMLFLDSDDLLPACFVENACKAFSRHPNWAAASSDCNDITCLENGEKRLDVVWQWPEGRDVSSDLLQQKLNVTTSATVVRRTFFDQVGGYDEKVRVSEDGMLAWLLAAAGEWGKIPGEPVYCRTFASFKEGVQAHLSFDRPNALQWLRTARRLELRYEAMGRLPCLYDALARTWYKAGRLALKNKRYRMACYASSRAISLKPLVARYYSLWLRAAIKRIGV